MNLHKVLFAWFLLAAIAFGYGQTTSVEGDEIIVRHKLGTTKVTSQPKRIAVFSYEILDILDRLGVPVIGLPKSNVPAYLSEYKGSAYQDFGTLFEPNFERLFAQKPDLILISARQASLYEEFVKIAPTIYLAPEANDFLASVREMVRTVAVITATRNVAEALLVDMDRRVRAIKTTLGARSTALFLMVNDKALSVYGPGSRFGFIHSDFGFIPADAKITVSTHGQAVNYEYLAARDPDYLFVLDRAAATGGTGTAAQVLDTPLLSGLAAFRNRRVVYVDPEAWYLATGGISAMSTMLSDVERLVR